MTLESGRTLGLASSLIIVVTPVLFVGTFLALFFGGGFGRVTVASVPWQIILYSLLALVSLASFVLFLLAMRRLSEHYREPSIFNNALYAIILNVLGGVAGVIFSFIFFGLLIGRMQIGVPASAVLIQEIIFAVFGLVLVVFTFAIVGAVFYNRAFNSLAEKSGVRGFKDAGLLLLIGYVLTIVFVGGLVVWIGWILAAGGFFSLKRTSASTYLSASQPVCSPGTAQKKFCTYCGAENDCDAKFCIKCGRPT